MSNNNIPFDIQTEIMKRLPVAPLIRFRSVSKQWKSFIDSSKFINDHTHINRNGSQCHLFVRHKYNAQDPEYTSIIDDDTFPNQKVSLTLPPPLSLMNYRLLNMFYFVNGLLCLTGFHSELKTSMAVLWNPIIRKSIGIVIPSQSNKDYVIGFGFCDTSDPTLVKVNRYYKESECWEVMLLVFTLSSRVWTNVSNIRPAFGSCVLREWNQVCTKGCIYWGASYWYGYGREGTNVIVSFDLKSNEFGQVCLPDRLLQTYKWKVDQEVNDSLRVLEIYYDCDDDVEVCGVWMMEFLTKSFTKIFTVKVPGVLLFNNVLGYRKNGEVIIEVNEGNKSSRLEVYNPLLGRTNGIGINGKYGKQRVCLYMETLLLLDQTSSIIIP